jgi:uncharacterized protein YndB with AHSA1/START domain
MPVDHSHAVLERRGDRWALVFERVLPWPPERVWQALTAREELEHWHPTPFRIEPRGRVEFRAPRQVSDMGPGRVLECDPPRVLAHTWFEDELRWELSEEGSGGCRLRLVHTFDDRYKAARDGAGWHLCLQALQEALEGTPHARGGEQERHIPDGWSELNDEYQRRFEIPPELATPVPGT